ncbi:hypothetical protein ACFCV3_02145 [Kribbella sp. NPDC056345]|uniref:hypothetical protein n=1 Tax=Kribbella sp. NPDC056345 TaxID=3345789 RepID=UPI0035DAA8E1
MKTRILGAAVGITAALALLCTSCAGGNPPDGPTSSASAPLTSASPRQTSAGPSTTPEEQALLDKVRAEGQLTVLVTLKLPQTPSGSAEHKKAIADVQDQLLGQLKPLGVQVKTRFELYPLLTLRVNEATLRHLQESPLVDRLHEDELNKPQA